MIPHERGVAGFISSCRLVVRLLRMMRGLWPAMAGSIALALAAAVVALVVPQFTKSFFDQSLPRQDPSLLNTLVLGLLVAAVAAAVTNGLRGFVAQVVSARMARMFGLSFFDRLQRQPSRVIDERRVGEVLSRTGDLQRSVSFVSGVVRTVILNGVYVLVVPPMLFALEWRLALLSLVAIPVTSAVSLRMSETVRRLARLSAERSAEVTASQTEALGQLRLIKSLAAEADSLSRSRGRHIEAEQASIVLARTSALVGLGNALVRASGTALYTWFAWHLLLSKELSVGSFMAFSAYVGYLVGPAGQVASLFTELQQASVSLSRFFEYYDAPIERGLEDVPPPWKTHPGPVGIRFERVAFGYDAARPFLQDVSFHASAGEVVAIVGPSGSGKSSLLRLLVRMYEPTDGRILLGGRELERFDVVDLRRQVGVVWQETAVLSGTVRENLQFGNRPLDDRELLEALDLAGLRQYVESLPARLETTVTEGGVTLSAGQRQRLAIARIAARRPSLIALDEATANLDRETQESVLERLTRADAAATVLLITHQSQSLCFASRVYHLHNGTLQGGVPHAELLGGSPEYVRFIEGAAVGAATQ